MDEKKIVTFEMFKKYHEQLMGSIEDGYGLLGDEDICASCIHCIDKKYWTCEYDEPCINGSLYESESEEKFNEIET